MTTGNKKSVLIIGSGKSGIAATAFLKRTGRNPILFDENNQLDENKINQELKAVLSETDADSIRIVKGEIPEDLYENLELSVVSPGVPMDNAVVLRLKEKKIPIIGEIQLAYDLEKGRVAAITGTNGKTTTTTLVGEMAKDFFEKVFVVGNIGTPYTDSVLESTKDSVTVAEISSFQLESITTFHPEVSAILNVTPDHLNRHKTMEIYNRTKEMIASNQNEDEYCILNYENEYTRDFGEKRCKAKVIWFSSARKLENGYYLADSKIWYAKEGSSEFILGIEETKLVGICNYENIMAALGMGMALGITRESMINTIREFKPVEHRIEYVNTKSGVDFYNDSKGTNPDAAIQGIRAMTRPTILIGGGYDKQSSYDEWIEEFNGKVKLLILIGQTREKIAECARAHKFEEIVMADTFEEAFSLAVKNAENGDAVLLSPACASWGMFPNYEVRGQIFKDLVNSL